MTSLASSGPPPRLDMQKQKQKKQSKKQKTKNIYQLWLQMLCHSMIYHSIYNTFLKFAN